MNKIKKIIVVALCVALSFGSISVYAASSEQSRTTRAQQTRVANCPACKHSVTSYGVDPIHGTMSHYANAGTRCDGCGQIVQSGTQHWYYTNTELYYFMCSDSCCKDKPVKSRIFTVPFDNPTVKGHEIQKTSK
ncbi:hypothetical protein [Agathobacter sp.]